MYRKPLGSMKSLLDMYRDTCVHLYLNTQLPECIVWWMIKHYLFVIDVELYVVWFIFRFMERRASTWLIRWSSPLSSQKKAYLLTLEVVSNLFTMNRKVQWDLFSGIGQVYIQVDTAVELKPIKSIWLSLSRLKHRSKPFA